jgi:hypothetical protein
MTTQSNYERLAAINVNEHLSYNPETGLFIWRTKRGRKSANSVAGSVGDRGYILINAFGKRMYAHRLAVLAMTGEFPPDVVDHINGDKSDNRWGNLRSCTQSVNMENRQGHQRNSKTSLLGSSPHVCGKFMAQITRNGTHRYLGLYKTAAEAHSAYLAASKEN